MNETKSTCCYCGTGCGVIVESEGDRIAGVRGDPGHPLARRAMPGPTRLMFRNKRFEPIDGYDALFA